VSSLEAHVDPRDPKAADEGRQQVGLQILLQTYFVQQWFNLWTRAWKWCRMNR
jgi:hypothetical protein